MHPPDHRDPPDALDTSVYDELKRIARHYLRSRASGATISTTELVHDAYLKFGNVQSSEWNSRAHFFGAAARAMRQVLMDYARNRQAGKRGGGMTAVTLTSGAASLEVNVDELLVLDDALNRLRTVNERLARVVELRFFAGLEDEEIAGLLEVSARTVGRDWTKARLYLVHALGHT